MRINQQPTPEAEPASPRTTSTTSTTGETPKNWLAYHRTWQLDRWSPYARRIGVGAIPLLTIALIVGCYFLLRFLMRYTPTF